MRDSARKYLTCLIQSGWTMEKAKKHVIATIEQTYKTVHAPKKRPRQYEPPPPANMEVAEKYYLQDKDDMECSSLQLAAKFDDVLHVKTCYSKMFGGWYSLIYHKKNGTIQLSQFAWVKKSKKWKLMYINKNISEKQLETLLTVPVADEICSTLR